MKMVRKHKEYVNGAQWKESLQNMILSLCIYYPQGSVTKSLAESQKGISTDKWCSVENQKGTIAM